MKKNNLEKIILSSVATLAFPMLAMAETVGNLITTVTGWLKNIITLLFVLVTLYFILGVIKYVKAGGDDKAVQEGKKHMIYGIIGMAVMAAAWGIVGVLVSSFGVGSGTIPTGL